MSYPPVRYDGDGGEVTAWLRPASTPPELSSGPGRGAAYLATGAQTGGRFGLYRWDMDASRSGPDPHFHRTISESFFVLRGVVQIYDGRAWVDTQAGDFVHVPEGGIHGFRNASGEAASMLLLFTPGAPREDYFETLADAARRAAMDEAAWAEFYDRHDTYWV